MHENMCACMSMRLFECLHAPCGWATAHACLLAHVHMFAREWEGDSKTRPRKPSPRKSTSVFATRLDGAQTPEVEAYHGAHARARRHGGLSINRPYVPSHALGGNNRVDQNRINECLLGYGLVLELSLKSCPRRKSHVRRWSKNKWHSQSHGMCPRRSVNHGPIDV